MLKSVFISAIGLLICLCCYAQDLIVIFTPRGGVTNIDSVTAINQRSNQSVTIPGNDTVVLNQSSGINYIYSLNGNISVSPNPFSGHSNVKVIVPEYQKVRVWIHDLAGSVIARSEEYMQPGLNTLEVFPGDKGFYVIVVETREGLSSCKLINLESSGGNKGVKYMGVSGDYYCRGNDSKIKSSLKGNTLSFILGDIIQFKCKSGDMATIIADSPKYSTNYYVEFAQCEDLDGKNYPVIKIGNQTWMAQNLAYLPTVVNSGYTQKYYVYDYSGNDLEEAKATENYKKYGVLYNYYAALISCPAGWHLSTEEDWKELMDYLINNGFGYGGSGDDVAKALASFEGWTMWSFAGTIGHDQVSNNLSGFNALPGGYLDRNGQFDFIGGFSYFCYKPRPVPYQRFGFKSMNYYQGVVLGGTVRIPDLGLSVRCVKND